ncbi:putative virion structural protein [Erwinia phage vB_EamM_Phobos]|uniref:putative virion structural protein n=1 Tax=Erwinia phage vB_EamM_Phobos TaxID=1883377 RepID=UPI00081C9836|nr:putative virion structural protein [Erwinia phage vB_EamM_Phobos]ANZ50398.1 putative virion structural protein [Erwinia phage vB_EamM_Phobos]
MIFTRRSLIDISCLVDDRLGLVEARYPHLLDKLELAAFYTRITEVWASIIGIPDFYTEYANRDVAVLKASRPTQFINVFREKLQEDLLAIKLSAPIERPQVTINFYPYTDLSQLERKEFETVFRELFPGVEINTVCIPLKVLTPEFLRGQWDAWFTYDYYDWMELQSKNLATRIPRFVLHRPGILTKELTPETVEVIKRDGVNPFDESKKFLAEYITVETLKVSLFCHVPDLDITPPPPV